MEEYILEAMKYFTVEEWTKMDGSEQSKYGKVCYVYFACLRLHIKVEVPKFMIKKDEIKGNKGIYKCTLCNTKFLLKEKRNEHKKMCGKLFEKKENLICTQCNYTAKSIAHFNRHKQKHTKQKNFLCEYCGTAISRKEDLMIHVRNKHLEQREDKFQYQCDKCIYKTNHKAALKRHLLIHSDVKKYVCEICKKGFHQKIVLIRHSFQHNQKERPHKCLKCDKTFIEKSYLETHLKAVHAKIKQHQCNICDYSTYHIGHLKIHSLKHSTAKPFKCDFCKYETNRNDNLKTHLKKKHGK